MLEWLSSLPIRARFSDAFLTWVREWSRVFISNKCFTKRWFWFWDFPDFFLGFWIFQKNTGDTYGSHRMGFDAQKRSPNSHHRWNFASKIVVSADSAEKSWLVSRLFYFGNGSYRWLGWARLPERLQINQKAIVLSQKDTSGQIEAQFRVWCFDNPNHR